MEQVRRVALAEVSWRRLARLTNVDGDAVRRVLSMLVHGGDEVYKRRRESR